MSSRWQASIDSVNEYVNVLRDSGVSGKINFIAFDVNINQYVRAMTWNANVPLEPVINNSVLEVVRSDVDIASWPSLTGHEVTPRGGTPLYDAVIETKDLLKNDQSDKGIFLIITDGGENSSRSNKAGANSAIEVVKSKGWEVVFLGANFDNSVDAKSMGMSREYYASYQDGTEVQTMNYMATRSALYASGTQSMALSDADRKKNNLA